RAEEFDFYLEDLQARGLIVAAEDDTPARAVALDRGIPVLEATPQGDQPAGLFALAGVTPWPARRTEMARPGDVALALHTSGTTSRPKLAPLTHANIWAMAHDVAAAVALQPGDCCLNMMPLYHCHGLLAATLSSLAAGGRVVCTPGFDPGLFWECLEA